MGHLCQQQGHRSTEKGLLAQHSSCSKKSHLVKINLGVFCRAASMATSPFSELQDKIHNQGHVLINFRNTCSDLKEKVNYLSGNRNEEPFPQVLECVKSKQCLCLLGNWPSPVSLSTLL